MLRSYRSLFISRRSRAYTSIMAVFIMVLGVVREASFEEGDSLL
jgi:hypothetical protein